MNAVPSSTVVDNPESIRLTDGAYIELVRSLFKTLVPTIIMAVSFTVVAAYCVHQTHDLALACLLVGGVAAAIARIVLLLLYRRDFGMPSFDAVRAGRVERRFALAYFGFALIFGAFAARAMAIVSDDLRLLLIGLLFGYGAGVAAGISLRPWISIPSVLIAICPSIGICLTLAEPGQWGAGVLTAVFLAGGIGSMLRRYRETSKQIAMHRLLAAMDRSDELTGLPNRIGMQTRFDQIAIRTTGAEMVAVHHLELIGVNAVNDAYGHRTGDILLKAASERIERALPADAFSARLGGLKFAIVQSTLGHPRQAEIFARDLHAAVSKPYLMGGHDLQISAVIGYASALQQNADLEDLSINADRALERAQLEAKNVVGHSGSRWTGRDQV